MIASIAEQFSGELGVAAKHFSTGEGIAFNEDRVFATASAIKVPVLMEVFRQVAEGTIDLEARVELGGDDIALGGGVLRDLTPGCTFRLRDLATLMVVISDNTATNILIDHVGGTAPVNDLMRDYGLTRTVLNSKVDFELGDAVMRFGESTPAEMLRLMEMLVLGEAVSSEASQEMLEMMKRQQYRAQFPRYFDYSPWAAELGTPQRLEVANKTGGFPGIWVDVGVVFMPGNESFGFCAMNQNSTDTSVAAEHEGVVVNGLVGRAILQHWWRGEDAPVLESAYYDNLVHDKALQGKDMAWH